MAYLLDSRALEVFVAVSDAGSMSGAGRILGISQAAVSQQIARLEDAIGLKVIERGGRELRLTPAGAHLRHLGKRVLGELSQAERAMTRFKGYSVPRLTVGLMESMSEILAKTIISALETQVEQLEVQTSLNYRYRESLFDETIDLVITPQTEAEDGLELHGLATEPLILALPKNLVQFEDLDFENVAATLPQARLPFRRRIGRMAEDYLTREAILVPRAFDLDQTAMMLDTVRHGQAWALITPFVLIHGNMHPDEIDVFPLRGSVPTRTICIASKAGRFGSLPHNLALACRQTIAQMVREQLTKVGPRIARSVLVHTD